MKRKIGEIYNKPIIEGDINLKGPNEIHKSELCGSNSEEGGGNSEEEHWIGIRFGNEDMGINPFPAAVFNFTEVGRILGNIYINKGIGIITEHVSYGYGSIAHGGLLTYGDMMIPFKNASGVTYYQLSCVNIKKEERLIYTNADGAMQHDTPYGVDYNFGDKLPTLEEVENKILESKLFTNYSRNERIVAILSVMGLLVASTGNAEWGGDTPIDEYLTNMGIDTFTTLEIVYPNKDEMLNTVKDIIINFKG